MRVDWHRSGFAIPDSSMNPNVFLSYVRICCFFFFFKIIIPDLEIERTRESYKNIYIYIFYLFKGYKKND